MCGRYTLSMPAVVPVANIMTRDQVTKTDEHVRRFGGRNEVGNESFEPAPTTYRRAKNNRWWMLVTLSVAADFLMLPTVRLFAYGTGPTLPQAILAFGMLGSMLAQ